MSSSTRDQITQFLSQNLTLTTNLCEAVRYAVLPVGKCLRGHLLVRAADLLGQPNQNSIILASAVELIHSYSLVHDDLPALDNDDFRRGKESCHKKFGEAQAILAGNFILMRAFELIGQTQLPATQKAAQLVNKMIEGQAQDLALTPEHELEHILKVYHLKTGALFALTCYLSGIIAGCGTNVLSTLENYGYKIGLAFQLLDDLSDNSGLAKVIGYKKLNQLILENITLCKAEGEKLQHKFFPEFAEYIFEKCHKSKTTSNNFR